MNWFLIAIGVLHILAGTWYITKSQPWFGLLMIIYGISDFVIIKMGVTR